MSKSQSKKKTITAAKTAHKKPVKPVVKTLKKTVDISQASAAKVTSIDTAKATKKTSEKPKTKARKKPASVTKKATNRVEKKTVNVAAKKTERMEPTNPSTPFETMDIFSALTKIPMVQNQFFNIKEPIMTNTKNYEKMAQDAANWNKETAEACQKSINIYAKGFQDCMSMYTDMVQKMAEQQNKLFKEMLSKKSMNEVSDALQSASQENFNQIMANVSKISEQSVKVAMDSFEPINEQMNKSIKKASNAMAA